MKKFWEWFISNRIWVNLDIWGFNLGVGWGFTYAGDCSLHVKFLEFMDCDCLLIAEIGIWLFNINLSYSKY